MARGYSLGAFVKEVYNLVYPVGICIDFDNATNPNTTFPGTTWVQVTDGLAYRAAISNVVGSGAGQIGSVQGSDTATLAEANLPAHSHTSAAHSHTIAHTHNIGHNHGTGTAASNGAHTHTVSGTAASAGAHTHTFDVRYLNTSAQANYVGAGANGSSAGTQTTSSSGAHTHSVSGTAASAGAHTHTVDIPTYTGNSGGSSAANSGSTTPDNTGSVGSGAAFNVMNRSHYYARWKRTA